jgi:hypothetical protein
MVPPTSAQLLARGSGTGTCTATGLALRPAKLILLDVHS